MSDSYNELKHEFRSVRTLVGYVLAHYEIARNSDTKLIELCNQVRPGRGHFETIRRIRQKIQNEEGRFLPTDPKIIERRKSREKNIKRYVREN